MVLDFLCTATGHGKDGSEPISFYSAKLRQVGNPENWFFYLAFLSLASQCKLLPGLSSVSVFFKDLTWDKCTGKKVLEVVMMALLRLCDSMVQHIRGESVYCRSNNGQFE